MRGHRDQITAIHFVSATEDTPSSSSDPTATMLLTSSKDTFLKLWDLTTQHCIQTVVAHRSEIWTMDVNLDQNMIFTGSGDGEMKGWRLDYHAMSDGLKETEAGEVSVVDSHVSDLF